MATRANSKERILASAETIILQKGYSATSIEDIIAKASITKGGFFYHFNGKTELARSLVDRYLEQDAAFFTGLFEQADQLSEDPLQQLLIFLNLFADMMKDLPSTHPGCLVASFTYESKQFDDEIREKMKQGLLQWRTLIASRLELIQARYQTKEAISNEALADMFTTTIEGGIIISRVFQNNTSLVEQILAYRHYLRLLFEPGPQ